MGKPTERNESDPEYDFEKVRRKFEDLDKVEPAPDEFDWDSDPESDGQDAGKTWTKKSTRPFRTMHRTRPK